MSGRVAVGCVGTHSGYGRKGGGQASEAKVRKGP